MKIIIDTDIIKNNITSLFARKPSLREKIEVLEKELAAMKKTRENQENENAQKSAS